MTFAKNSKGREIAFIMRLVNTFGLVEQRQMRKLFAHMNDKAYGMILSRLNNEGLIHWQKNGEDLAASRMTPGKHLNDERVRCFWAFIAMKDAIRDYCAGDPPVLMSFLTDAEDCVMIPVTEYNIDAINAHAVSLPDETIRFLVARFIQDVDGVVPRGRNDYVLLVDDTGQTETYEL